MHVQPARAGAPFRDPGTRSSRGITLPSPSDARCSGYESHQLVLVLVLVLQRINRRAERTPRSEEEGRHSRVFGSHGDFVFQRQSPRPPRPPRSEEEGSAFARAPEDPQEGREVSRRSLVFGSHAFQRSNRRAEAPRSEEEGLTTHYSSGACPRSHGAAPGSVPEFSRVVRARARARDRARARSLFHRHILVSISTILTTSCLPPTRSTSGSSPTTSRIAPHSIASPRAMPLQCARSATLVLPAPSSIFEWD